MISKGFKGTPKTIGEHVLKKRLDDKLTQKELAARLGVDPITLLNWEKGRTKEIPAAVMPAVVAYIGHNPEPEPQTVGDRLRWKRRSLGWTTKEAARRNSVDTSTWEAWEKMASWPKYPRFRDFLQQFLDLPNAQLVEQVRRVRSPAQRRAKPKEPAA